MYLLNNNDIDNNNKIDMIVAYGLLKIMFYVIINDIYFYITHKIFHRKFLYNKIHLFHHRVYFTSAVSALDANFIEHLLINLGSFIIGPLLWPCNLNIILFWTFLATFNTCLSHSGYNIISYDHYKHHINKNVNYGGGIMIIDYLVGSKI